jgi:hypothetical protein
MNIHNFEVLTSRDKAVRDKLFGELKYTGDKLERQVVKFSGVGEELVEVDGKEQVKYHSTWSVAYPKS